MGSPARAYDNSIAATPVDEFDLSTLDNALNVFENYESGTIIDQDISDSPAFKFDLLLDPKTLGPELDSLYTISEDLAGGKLIQKDKALKNLTRTIRLSGFGKEKAIEKGRPGDKQSDSTPAMLLMIPSASSPFASPEPKSWSRYQAGNFVGNSIDMPEMPEPYSGPYESEAAPFESSKMESSGFEPLDKDSPMSPPFRGRPMENEVVSGKRKAITEYKDGKGVRTSKRSKVNEHPQRRISEASYDDRYSQLVKIIYMIHCPDTWDDYHEALAYEDVPVFLQRSKPGTDLRLDSKLIHLNGSRPVYDLASLFTPDNVDDETAIIVFRHIRCEENQGIPHADGKSLRGHESLAIKSSILRRSIADVAQCYYDGGDVLYDGRKAGGKQMGELTISPAPLRFFHHYQRLLDYVETHPYAREHVTVLLEYCRRTYGSNFQEAKRLFAEAQVNQKHLEKLYLPNSIVISCADGNERAYVVSKWPYIRDFGSLELTCWAWQNNGTGWYRSRHTLTVPPISSSWVSIQSLAVCPAAYVSEHTRKNLIQRGMKLWLLKNPSYISYTGTDVQGEGYYPDSRFMVDYAVYKKMHEHALALHIYGPVIYSHDPWPRHLDSETTPNQEELLVMPHIVHGFYLTEKQWVAIYVDGVHEITWNKTAYDRLVIPSKTKELIRALVTVRTSQRGIKHGLGVAGKRVDLIAGKGNGLIMLLHGGPGTGKSLTAKSVAEIAEMPLYRVTCGDIGTTPESVEKYMGVVMHLGVTWNCVLLLDEADVFLEERSMSDLARNSLVSVFLRILEYYDGILILTSNRIGTFDEAFKSRIQVALHYEKLTIPSRKKIWGNFIDMLEEDGDDVNFEEIRYKVDQLAKIDLNGRQIRNTMTTARQLAMFQACRLDWSHIEQALSVSTEFNEYIKRMQGHTDDQRARDEKLR